MSFHKTELGDMVCGDSLPVMQLRAEGSANLVFTSPPFALTTEKAYGNVPVEEYCEWFRPFGEAIHRLLADDGSFVLEVGGGWNKGVPTRNLANYRLLLMLVDELGFHLAQEFFWWNPSKLPSPAEWVTVRKVRVKDAVSTVWWLSKTPFPKCSNRRNLVPYSDAQLNLMRSGVEPQVRPSGHDISEQFSNDNGGAIGPNLIAVPNTESKSQYLGWCRRHELTVHPARFPAQLPAYFVKFLTDEHDLVVDPFAGSCTTGMVAEHMDRRWLCVEREREYLKGALGRFLPRLQLLPTMGGPYELHGVDSVAWPDLLLRTGETR